MSGLPSQLKRNFPSENLILEPELTGLDVDETSLADVESETGNNRILRFKREDDDDANDDDDADGDGKLENVVSQIW